MRTIYVDANKTVCYIILQHRALVFGKYVVK